MYKGISINYSDFEPLLSSKAVSLHYNKHYLGYLNKLNSILSYLDYDYRFSVSEIIENIDYFPIKYRDSILYNAGGVVNHELFFNTFGSNHNMMGILYDKILSDFGSYDEFVNEFKRVSNLLVGSGYTFLVLDKNKKLLIINLSNQDSPLSLGFYPIMNIDLWEHSYYLDYYNDRSKYINDFFSMIDFSKLDNEYKKAIKEI